MPIENKTPAETRTILTSADNWVNLPTLAQVSEARFLGRAAGSGTGNVQSMTASSARTAIGLGSVTNTSDADKPISTAVAAAIAAANWVDLPRLAQISEARFLGRAAGSGTGNVQSMTAAAARTAIGLDNVTNTSDADKPISTAVAAALDGLAIDEIARVVETQLATRPGDAPEVWAITTTGLPEVMAPLVSPNIQATVSGRVLRITGARVTSPRWWVRLDPTRTFVIRWIYRRPVNVADPAGAAVRAMLGWVNAIGAVSNADIIADTRIPFASGGRQIVSKVIAASAAATVDVVWPVGAVYVRPYLQTFEAGSLTDLEAIEVEDITNVGGYSPDLAALNTTLAGLTGLPARMFAVEAATTITAGSTHATRAQLVSAIAGGLTVPVGTLVAAGSLFYRWVAAATMIADLPNLVPAIVTTPNHFADNLVPGTTDMTAAINAAIAAASSVSLLAESYAIFAPGITISTTTGKSLIGAGEDLTTLTSNVDGLNIITVTAPGSARPRGVTVQGVAVAYTGAAATGGAHLRIVRGALLCNFSHIRLVNIYNGFHCQGGQKLFFDHITSNEQGNGTNGFAMWNFDTDADVATYTTTEIYISHFDCYGRRNDNSAVGLRYGIYTNKCDGIFIEHGHIFETLHGIYLNPDQATNPWQDTVASIKAVNLYIDDPDGSGIFITGNADRYRGLNFTETYIRAASANTGAVYINAIIEDMTFTGGKIYGNTFSGILTGPIGDNGDAKNLTVTGMLFTGNNTANNAAHGDIVWRGDGGSITGTTHVGGGAAGYSILLASDSRDTDISGNNVHNSTATVGGTVTGGLVNNGTNNWIDGVTYGTSADGEWKRDKSGNLECWRSIASSASVDVTWTYPFAFLAATVPVVHGGVASGAGPAVSIFNLSGAPTATSSAFNIFNTASARLALTARLSARGRWK